MCLAVPVKVKAVNGDIAEVEAGGMSYQAGISLTPDVKVGDYVLLHAGYIITVLDQEQAVKTLEIFTQMDIVQNEN